MSQPADRTRGEPPEQWAPPLLDMTGTAGASADQHAARFEHHGVPPTGDGIPLVELVAALPSRASPRRHRWRQGARGERATALILAPLAHLGWDLLHDRRIPGTVANIDHLALGPNAVHVIESKLYRGRVHVDEAGDLRLGDISIQDKVDRVRWMVTEVHRRLELELRTGGTPVRGVLVMHGAQLPSPRFAWTGIDVVTPPELLPLLCAGHDLAAPQEPSTLVQAATDAFPPATATPTPTTEDRT